MPAWTSRMFWTSTSSGRRLVEADLRPCRGADTRSLLLSPAAGTTTCSHPTKHRKEAQLCGAEGGPRSQLGGGVPCCQDDVRKVRKVLGAGEAWAGLPTSLPILTLLLSPGRVTGGRHRCLRFIGVVPGPLEGKGQQKGPFVLPEVQVEGARRWTLWAPGRVEYYRHRWLFADPFPPQGPPHLPFISLGGQDCSGASCGAL